MDYNTGGPCDDRDGAALEDHIATDSRYQPAATLAMGVEKEILSPGDGATFPKAGDNLTSTSLEPAPAAASAAASAIPPPPALSLVTGQATSGWPWGVTKKAKGVSLKIFCLRRSLSQSRPRKTVAFSRAPA
eukprot:COSAG06_NODE_2583_length_6617_cov_18.685026_9_plen_132_part_00